MLLQEKLLMQEIEKLTLDSLYEYKLTDASSVQNFFDACQSVFIGTLVRSGVQFGFNNLVYTASIVDLVSAKGDIIDKASSDATRHKIVFDFYFKAVSSDGKKGVIEAERLLDGSISVLNSDGSVNTDIPELLAEIKRLCVLAARDPAAYENSAKAVKKTFKHQASTRAKAALATAYASGDEESIKNAEDSYTAARSAEIKDGQEKAAKSLEATAKEAKENPSAEDAELLNSLSDVKSFIYGWLVANVDFLRAILPNNRGDIRFFLRTVGRGSPRADRNKPGYYIYTGPVDANVNRTQQGIESHVHFRPDSIPHAPKFVRDWLKNSDLFTTRKTGEPAEVKGTINSNVLAFFLVRELGFLYDVTEHSDAYNTCRMLAKSITDFQRGYEYELNRHAARGTTQRVSKALQPENEFDLDFPGVEPVTASDYDADLGAPF